MAQNQYISHNQSNQDNPPAPPQHHILPFNYSPSAQPGLQHQTSRYQMPSVRQQQPPQQLQPPHQASAFYRPNPLPSSPQHRQNGDGYSAYPGNDASATLGTGFSFVNSRPRPEELYVDTQPLHGITMNSATIHTQTPSAGSIQSINYIASPTAVPNNSAIGSIGFDRLSLSPASGGGAGGRGYNPAAYSAGPSPPRHTVFPPPQTGSVGVMSPLMSPLMSPGADGFAGFGGMNSPIVPYNPANYATTVTPQNRTFSTSLLSPTGAFPTSGYAGGAYGPAQSYAIGGFDNRTSTIAANPAATTGWGYGGLQSLYAPSNPPPLPTLPGIPLDQVEGDDVDDWEEREWEAHEREWEEEQQRKAQAESSQSNAIARSGSHPLPRIPATEDDQDVYADPYTTPSSDRRWSDRNAPDESGYPPFSGSRSSPVRSGAMSTRMNSGRVPEGGGGRPLDTDAELDHLIRETEESYRLGDFEDQSRPSPSSHRLASPVNTSATITDLGFQDLGYIDGPLEDQSRYYGWDVDLPSTLAVQPTHPITQRRQSFEVGDENAFLPGRPLPAVPSTENTPNPPNQTMANSNAPDDFQRSASLTWRSTATEVAIPVRSKTDAGEHPPMAMNMNGAIGVDSGPDGRSHMRNSTMDMGLGIVDLPALPPMGSRFTPAKLGSVHFDKCTEPWAYSGLIRWLKELTEGEQDLRSQTVVDGLVRLFTHKVPTMNIADAETLSSAVVANLRRVGVMEQEEEWVRFTAGTIGGVVVQLTGGGCYSGRGHNDKGNVTIGVVGPGGASAAMVLTGRCYSRTCQRTLRRIELTRQETEGMEMDRGDKGQWTEFYGVSADDLKTVSKKEIERQHVIHEIVQKEEAYRRQLSVLSDLFRSGIHAANPAIVEPGRIGGFIESVFGRLDAVKKVNDENLLPQLKYRQLEQGPWLVGVSDIFREWIRKAKPAYVAYAAAYPHAHMVFRREIERNLRFRMFVDQARSDLRCDRLEWSTFLKAPISTLQHYGLLLLTVLKVSPPDTAETETLKKAIEEIKAVTHECDDRVAEMGKRIELLDLRARLKLRPNMQSSDLRLDQLGRELLHKGVLFRPRANRLGMIESYAVLFDHCLVLAKSGRDGYDVSRLPIPIDLLVLDTATVPGGYGASNALSLGIPGIRSGEDGSPASNGHAAGATAAVPSAADMDKPLFQFRIQHLGNDTYNLFTTSAAARDEWCSKIIAARVSHAAALRAQNAEPFKLRVLADAAFGYDAASASTTTASSAARPLLVTGSPLDRALREVDSMFAGGKPSPVCRAKVNCAVSFTYTATNTSPGAEIIAIGTDVGIYVADFSNPRGWTKAVSCGKVQQLAVMESFSVLLALIDKSLVAYPLEVVAGPVGGEGVNGVSANGSSNPSTPGAGSRKLMPQKLSGGRGDVGFFLVGRTKDRAVVFYKKKEGLSSVFKVMEPVAPKSSSSSSSSTASTSSFSSWSSIFKHRSADSFREFDKFYIPAECSNLSLFNSTVAITTARGFEVLTLDKKQTWTVPNLEGAVGVAGADPSSSGLTAAAAAAATGRTNTGGVNAAVGPVGATATAAAAVTSLTASIASRIQNQTPLTMFRLSDQEFLVCYSSRAVYVDRYGDVSRSVVMEFVGKAKAAALFGGYLVLFDPCFVEIRSVVDGRLKQVIVGRDVRCLDDGRAVLPAGLVPNAGTGNSMNGGSGGGGAGGRRTQSGSSTARLNGSSAATTVGGGGGSGKSGSTTTSTTTTTTTTLPADRNRTIKLAMRHPENERLQLVLELVLADEVVA